MEKIKTEIIAASYTYTRYRELIDQLLAEEKTTGPNQSPAMLEYTRLNVSRMKRLDKTARLTEASIAQLEKIDRPMIWLVITEGWCGDAAQIVPVLQKMADHNEQIDLRLILRDENLEVMDAFLTNGARSIPKVVFVDAEDHSVLGSWGPRPEAAQTMVMNTKEELQQITVAEIKAQRYKESQQELHTWYARDKNRSTQAEFLEALSKL